MLFWLHEKKWARNKNIRHTAGALHLNESDLTYATPYQWYADLIPNLSHVTKSCWFSPLMGVGFFLFLSLIGLELINVCHPCLFAVTLCCVSWGRFTPVSPFCLLGCNFLEETVVPAVVRFLWLPRAFSNPAERAKIKTTFYLVLLSEVKLASFSVHVLLPHNLSFGKSAQNELIFVKKVKEK